MCQNIMERLMSQFVSLCFVCMHFTINILLSPSRCQSHLLGFYYLSHSCSSFNTFQLWSCIHKYVKDIRKNMRHIKFIIFLNVTPLQSKLEGWISSASNQHHAHYFHKRLSHLFMLTCFSYQLACSNDTYKCIDARAFTI